MWVSLGSVRLHKNTPWIILANQYLYIFTLYFVNQMLAWCLLLLVCLSLFYSVSNCPSLSLTQFARNSHESDLSAHGWSQNLQCVQSHSPGVNVTQACIEEWDTCIHVHLSLHVSTCLSITEMEFGCRFGRVTAGSILLRSLASN